MVELIEKIISYILTSNGSTSVGEIQFWNTIGFLISLVLIVLIIYFLIAVPLYLKRIAKGIEQKNLIITNQKNSQNSQGGIIYNQSMQATPISNIQEMSNDIIGPNSTYVPPKKKKNIFTTDMKDLFKS